MKLVSVLPVVQFCRWEIATLKSCSFPRVDRVSDRADALPNKVSQARPLNLIFFKEIEVQMFFSLG